MLLTIAYSIVLPADIREPAAEVVPALVSVSAVTNGNLQSKSLVVEPSPSQPPIRATERQPPVDVRAAALASAVRRSQKQRKTKTKDSSRKSVELAKAEAQSRAGGGRDRQPPPSKANSAPLRFDDWNDEKLTEEEKAKKRFGQGLRNVKAITKRVGKQKLAESGDVAHEGGRQDEEERTNPFSFGFAIRL